MRCEKIHLGCGVFGEKLKVEHYCRDSHFAKILIISSNGSHQHVHSMHAKLGSEKTITQPGIFSRMRESLAMNKFFSLNDIHRKSNHVLNSLSFYGDFSKTFSFARHHASELTSSGYQMSETFNFQTDANKRIGNLFLMPHTDRPRDLNHCLSEQRKIAKEIVDISTNPHMLDRPPSFLRGHFLQQADMLLLTEGSLELFRLLNRLFKYSPVFQQYDEIRILASRGEHCVEHLEEKKPESHVLADALPYRRELIGLRHEKTQFEIQLGFLQHELSVYDAHLLAINSRIAINPQPFDIGSRSHFEVLRANKQKEVTDVQSAIHSHTLNIKHFS